MSCYLSITFAFSDLDGPIISTLMKSRPALFGKEVTIQKWIDKPLLVQCSRCHALGHNKASKACPLGYDSVRCYICGSAHKSEEHDQCCPRKHAVAGVCDCKNYKCLNCFKTGHNCRDVICPARDQYRQRSSRRATGIKNKGKGRDPAEGPGLTPTPPNEPKSGTGEPDTFTHRDDEGPMGQHDPPPPWMLILSSLQDRGPATGETHNEYPPPCAHQLALPLTHFSNGGTPPHPNSIGEYAQEKRNHPCTTQ